MKCIICRNPESNFTISSHMKVRNRPHFRLLRSGQMNCHEFIKRQRHDTTDRQIHIASKIQMSFVEFMFMCRFKTEIENAIRCNERRVLNSHFYSRFDTLVRCNVGVFFLFVGFCFEIPISFCIVCAPVCTFKQAIALTLTHSSTNRFSILFDLTLRAVCVLRSMYFCYLLTFFFFFLFFVWRWQFFISIR